MPKLNLVKRVVDIILKRPLQSLQVGSYFNMIAKLIIGFVNNKKTPWYQNPDIRNMVVTLITSLIGFTVPKAVGALKGLGNGPGVSQDAVVKLLHNLREEDFVYEFSPTELLGLFNKLRNSVFFIGSAVELVNMVTLLIFLIDLIKIALIMIKNRKNIIKYLLIEEDDLIMGDDVITRRPLSPRRGVSFHESESYEFRLSRFIEHNKHKAVSRRDLIKAFQLLEGKEDGY
jgi:hypothetical protein